MNQILQFDKVYALKSRDSIRLGIVPILMSLPEIATVRSQATETRGQSAKSIEEGNSL